MSIEVRDVGAKFPTRGEPKAWEEQEQLENELALPAHPLRIFVRLFFLHIHEAYQCDGDFCPCVCPMICCRTQLQACNLTNRPLNTWRATWSSTSALCPGNNNMLVNTCLW